MSGAVNLDTFRIKGNLLNIYMYNKIYLHKTKINLYNITSEYESILCTFTNSSKTICTMTTTQHLTGNPMIHCWKPNIKLTLLKELALVKSCAH